MFVKGKVYMFSYEDCHWIIQTTTTVEVVEIFIRFLNASEL